jgi:hypothetical protein
MICSKCGRICENERSWYGLHEKCFLQWFHCDSLEKFQNISRRQVEEDLPNKVINSSFFHGKFRKYSASLNENKYILKVEESEYPELPATEYLCNQIFQSLNINVPPFYLIFFEEKHFCFVTKNFMENFPESSLVHIYHFLGKNKQYNCENLLRIIEEKTGRLSAQEDFVFLTLADSLIGNHDRHGRNIGLIQSSKGYVLSPFYDNPSYLGTEIASLLGADHQPAGAIWTKTSKEPVLKDYIFEWKRLGFESVVERFRKQISLDKIQKLIQSSYLTDKRKEAFFRLICKRTEQL